MARLCILRAVGLLLLTLLIPARAALGRPMAIVSLSPAMSRSLVELDLGDRLIGVGEHDAAAPAGLPVVGNYLSPNIERLITLRPTHVVMMTGKEGAHGRLVQLAARQPFELVAFAVPSTAEEAIAILHHPSRVDLGEALGVADRAAVLAMRIRARLGALRALTADQPRPRVLLAFGVNPVWVSGPGSVEDDLLSYLGAENAVAGAGQAAMMLDREKLMGSSAQVLILLMPGAPPLQSLAEDVRLDAFRGLRLPAMESGRVALVADPLVLLVQSAAVDDVAAALAKAIHPQLTDAIDALMCPPPVETPGDAALFEAAATEPCETPPAARATETTP